MSLVDEKVTDMLLVCVFSSLLRDSKWYDDIRTTKKEVASNSERSMSKLPELVA